MACGAASAAYAPSAAGLTGNKTQKQYLDQTTKLLPHNCRREMDRARRDTSRNLPRGKPSMISRAHEEITPHAGPLIANVLSFGSYTRPVSCVPPTYFKNKSRNRLVVEPWNPQHGETLATNRTMMEPTRPKDVEASADLSLIHI